MLPRLPDDARAVSGQPIAPAWQALQEWVDDLQPAASGNGVRGRAEPAGGTHFVGPRRRGRPQAFFRVGIASGVLGVIERGWCNGEMPVITDARGGEVLYLDGRQASDRKPSGRIPYLDLRADDGQGGPGPENLSYICLRARVEPASGRPAVEALGPEWLSVVHRATLPPGWFEGGMPEIREDTDRGPVSTGLWPLAILSWLPGGETVGRFDAYTVHNLQHRYVPAETDGALGRHWFFGAT